ncbi:DUF6624 domain-containing protein [Chryseobacterium sp. OV279]|uniref:DUF6624 domain-containing protein n=1 Tax=Chryseobacterium sp. OV279 TaxID=1500285 RepID=UPI0009104EDB|nr:DUF6624 domain-containing protein [Chryseobacterium sp. OV279]SHF79055.1 hypothetical protein SAMN02787100_2601 [Chryseobacterium sp. OV279]
MNEIFSRELIERAQKDLSVREKLASEGKLYGGYHPEMELVHRQNAERLREIIKEIGFPTISKVGAKANDAAWLIIQHSIGEPEFMKDCYKLMTENYSDTNPTNIAYLYDRIQVFQSKPQRYGTQLTAEGVSYPVEDKNNLNKRRIQVNLTPLSQEEINMIPLIEDIPEIDGKDPDYTAWRIKTGWISEII